METEDRIIFPLDNMSLKTANDWMTRLNGRIGYVKVGLEMFLRSNWAVVEAAHILGHKVMLDLKLHDIPATMEKATFQAVDKGVELLTVHASAGRDAMAKCVEATKGSATNIVAVTVLTSLNEEFIQRVFQPARYGIGYVPNVVERLVIESTDAAVDWFVCSPKEAALIHAIRDTYESGGRPIVITPGIRLAGGDEHDQKRVDTPSSAVKAGADHLVIGRPIREAEDPDATIATICADIESV